MAEPTPVEPEPTPPTPPTSSVWQLEQLASGAKLLPGLDAVHRPINTAVPEAQAFFDQGLALTWGFNHDEAARSYAKAGMLDPNCAICWWGAALTLGPNYNMPMLPERAAAAWDALGRARAAMVTATPVEKALIEALTKRYQGPEYLEPEAMQPYQEAYGAAMREVAKAFPDDLDVQVLFAESLMNIRPWKLWTSAGEPGPDTEEIVATIEAVLAKQPEHVGANHYYIHAIEASQQPEKAIAAADRLGELAPGAGHLVHMPAHIYQRVGRYMDAVQANRDAIVADQKYLASVEVPGYYPFYVGHNYGFLAYSAAMLGRSAEAIEAAKQAAASIPMDMVCGMPGMDFFWSEPLLVSVRFGRWQEILAQPKPDHMHHPTLTALWHHAHGMALAATGKIDEAKADLAAIDAIRSELPEDRLAGLNSAHLVLELAAKVLEARIAEASQSPETIALWEAAVALEDSLAYNEPADWFYPVRHHLGAALLDAGRAKQAEAVYLADLERNPANGWSLFGLWRSLAAQKQKKQAEYAEAKFRAAWKDADIELTRSAF